jgi:hypothetical protein
MLKTFRIAKISAALMLAAALSGCGALPVAIPFALPVLVSGAGGGIAYTVTNVAYKTFSDPLASVEDAAHTAIDRMQLKEIGTEETEDGIRIVAFTRKLDILIELEEITPATTKVKVNAKRGPVLKDKATATEIIRQMGEILNGNGVPAGTKPRWARRAGGAG